MTARRFSVLGLPAPQGSKTHIGNGRMVESSKRVKPWRRQVAAAYVDHDFGDVLIGPVSVTWCDDSQIVAWHAYKHYATTDHPVGAQITIQEVMPNV